MIGTPDKTVAAAVEASKTIVNVFGTVAAQLQTCYVNQHRVLADPDSIYMQLRSAQRAIDLAVEVFKETQWPTQAVYDALDAGDTSDPR